MFEELNHFGADFNDIAKEYMLQYKAATDRVKIAGNRHEEEKLKGDSNTTRILAAEAQLRAEEAALHDVKTEGADNARAKMKKLREELVAAADEAMAAKPADVDKATMTLLDHADILSIAELKRLYDGAENVTMKRLIADAARKRSDSMKEPLSPAETQQRQMLRTLEYDAKNFKADTYLRKFDSLTDSFERGVRNDKIFERWDELTGDFIAQF